MNAPETITTATVEEYAKYCEAEQKINPKNILEGGCHSVEEMVAEDFSNSSEDEQGKTFGHSGSLTGDDIPPFDIEYVPAECFPDWYAHDPEFFNECRDFWTEDMEDEFQSAAEDYDTDYADAWDDKVDKAEEEAEEEAEAAAKENEEEYESLLEEYEEEKSAFEEGRNASYGYHKAYNDMKGHRSLYGDGNFDSFGAWLVRRNAG